MLSILRPLRRTRTSSFQARALLAAALALSGLSLGGCPSGSEDGALNPATLLQGIGDSPASATNDNNSRDPNSSPLTPTISGGGGDGEDGSGAGGDSGSNGEDTSTPNTGVEISSEPLVAQTRKGQPVTILLIATPRADRPLQFETVGSPEGGTLGPITQRSNGSADVAFAPDSGFVGRARFQYRAVDGSVASQPRSVVIIVYPEIRFSASPAGGMRPLLASAQAFTPGGESLPDAIYHWVFDDGGEHEFFTATPSQEYTFRTGGAHTVRMTLLIAGSTMPIICLAGPSGSSETATVVVNPQVQGRVTDMDGRGVGGVRIDAVGTTIWTTTDLTGSWSLTVSEGWTGSISPTLAGHTFLPPSWTITNINRDQVGVDFRADETPNNTKPTANSGSAAGNEDSAVTVTVSATDPEGDPLTFEVMSLPANGTLRDPSGNHLIVAGELPYAIRNSGASLVYTPAQNYNGSDTFAFRASDATLQSQNASVQLTVQPVNDAPLAIPQTVGVMLGASAAVRLTGLDVENSPLTFTVTSNPSHGTLTGTAPNLTYTATNGYSGSDSFNFTVSDGLLSSTAAAVSLSIAGWQPPIGVPEPAFGVREQPPALPNPWTTTVAGFYYVDNAHASSTDTSNTNGYPNRPRRTIPSNLPAGSVVEVRGGPYTTTVGGVIPLGGAGTASQPIFIRGGATRPKFQKPCDVRGSYVIIDGIDIDGWSTGNDTGISFGNNVHHCALRNSEVRNGPDATTSAVSVGGSSGAPARYIVVFNTEIHDNGDWQATFDQDHHGIGVGEYSEYVWVLDNRMYHNSGDGIQINAGNFANYGTLHHVYVGGCEAWENKQTGMWSKFATDVVFSQNTVHDHRPSDSSGGAGMGWQYGPERVWLLYNEIYNCEYGISCATISGPGGDGTGQNQYIIGNVIHDIRQTTSTTTGSWRAGAAITLRQEAGMIHVVNNTIYNCDLGVTNPRPNRCRIINNIFSNITLDHVWVENNNAANGSTLTHSLFDSPARIRWNGSTQRNLTQFRAANPSQGAGCIEGNALFVNGPAGDFHLQAASPAANAGTADSVYSAYQTLYALNIAIAYDGAGRPIGNWDMGAFER